MHLFVRCCLHSSLWRCCLVCTVLLIPCMYCGRLRNAVDRARNASTGRGKACKPWITILSRAVGFSRSGGSPRCFRMIDQSDARRRVIHAGGSRRPIAWSRARQALKVLCEPHCVPSSVNAQPEECPVLLIIGRIGIRHYAYQSETIALSTGLDTAAQLRPLEPGVLKAA